MTNKTQVKVNSLTDYFEQTEEGKEVLKDNTKLIKREIAYFTSDENQDKEGLQKKVGSNDESYKAILRNLKFNCLEADETYIDEIEKFFTDRLVKELILNNKNSLK